MNQRMLLLRKMWERAWELSLEGKWASVAYDTKQEAVRTRMNLYSAVRKFRENQGLDPDFSDRISQMEIVIDEEDGKWVLKIRHVSLNPLTIKLAEALGISTSPDMDEMDAMARRLMEAQNDQSD